MLHFLLNSFPLLYICLLYVVFSVPLHLLFLPPRLNEISNDLWFLLNWSIILHQPVTTSHHYCYKCLLRLISHLLWWVFDTSLPTAHFFFSLCPGYREGFLWKRGRDNGQFLSRKFILSEREGALKYFNKQDVSKMIQHILKGVYVTGSYSAVTKIHFGKRQQYETLTMF